MVFSFFCGETAGVCRQHCTVLELTISGRGSVAGFRWQKPASGMMRFE